MKLEKLHFTTLSLTCKCFPNTLLSKLSSVVYSPSSPKGGNNTLSSWCGYLSHFWNTVSHGVFFRASRKSHNPPDPQSPKPHHMQRGIYTPAVELEVWRESDAVEEKLYFHILPRLLSYVTFCFLLIIFYSNKCRPIVNWSASVVTVASLVDMKDKRGQNR